MLVHRVENEKGVGPFHAIGTTVGTTGWVSHLGSVPAPYSDFPDAENQLWESNKQFHFGFDSRETLLLWAREKGRRFFAQNDFYYTIYESDEVIEGRTEFLGGHQVAFNKEKAKLIARKRFVTANSKQYYEE